MVINGWAVYALPLLLGQIASLQARVERDCKKDPANYQNRPNARLLSAIRAITRERVPHDPTDKRYRLGSAG